MNLVFVYNADSGLFNTLTDIAHKLISPSTYECNLCHLTHGNFTAREEWLHFLKSLEMEMEFLHRDEFVEKYPAQNSDIAYPAIFVKDSSENSSELKIWVDSEVINNLTTTDELIEMIRAALLRREAGVKGGSDDFLSLPL